MHVSVGAVAAIVPRSAISNAGHSEETWRHSLVLNAGRRPPLLQKFSRRVVAGVWNWLQRKICSAVLCKKASPYSILRWTCVLREDGHGDIDISSRARDRVSPPLNGIRRANLRNHTDDKGNKKTRLHAANPFRFQTNRTSPFLFQVPASSSRPSIDQGCGKTPTQLGSDLRCWKLLGHVFQFSQISADASAFQLTLH